MLQRIWVALLQLDGTAGLFDVGLQLVGLLALDALLDGLGRLVHQRLGLLEAQALVDEAPKPIKEGIERDEAEKLKTDVEEAGGTVELK